MNNGRAFNQLIRYSIVGITANIFGYAVYILLTVLGISPKISISVLYSALVIIGFFANRRFTFGHNGHIGMKNLSINRIFLPLSLKLNL